MTLLQQEHLPVIAPCIRSVSLGPALLRRNIVVKEINLLALKEQKFRIGDVLFEMTGLCQPCSKIEQWPGCGAYNAMRGNGE